MSEPSPSTGLLLQRFAEGRAASRNHQPRPTNPHRPSDAAWDAWNAGWDEQEGPVYRVAKR